jgi:hypothetical protein
MKRKKNAKQKRHLVGLHIYGIFDAKKHTITKISLDHAEIQMDIALSGGLGENLKECEFDIKLAV